MMNISEFDFPRLSAQVLEICIAILVHKSIIVFSLSVKLVQSAVRPLWVALYVAVFAVMSPLGIGIGIIVIEAQLEAGAFIQAVLEGLAAGTFVYITFLEILPHELNSPERPLLKVFFLLFGFSVMAGLSFLGWETLIICCAPWPENWSLEEIEPSQTACDFKKTKGSVCLFVFLEELIFTSTKMLMSLKKTMIIYQF